MAYKFMAVMEVHGSYAIRLTNPNVKIITLF